MRIALFEIQKICKKKSLVLLLAAFLLANVSILWYADGLRRLPPAAAYQEIQEQLACMTEDRKGAYLLENYKKAYACQLLQELETIRGMTQLPEEQRQEMARRVLQEAPDLIERYSSLYYAREQPRYTKSFEEEAAFWLELYRQWQVTSDYPQRLSQIENASARLASISIFQLGDTDTFSSRNVQKTAADYKKLQETAVPYAITEGISFPLDFPVTDALAVCIAFFLALRLITEEKQKGLFGILRVTKKGRVPLIAGKILALSAVLLGSTAALYGSSLLYGALRYGLPSLALPVQALSGCIDSVFAMKLGEFLLLFFVMKWLACLAFAAILLLVTIHAKSAISGFLCSAGIYGLGAVLSALIPPLSSFQILRYINPVGILDTYGILGTYYNLNLAGYPVDLQSVALVFVLFLLALFMGLSVASFLFRRNWDAAEFFLAAHLRRRKRRQRGGQGGIFRHELYKVLVLNRAAVVLGLFFVLAVTQFPSFVSGMTIQQQRIRSYSAVLQGDVTEEKLAFLEQEGARIQEAHEKTDQIAQRVKQGELSPQAADALSAQYQAVLTREEAFRFVQERVAYVLQNPGTKILFEDGFLELMRVSGDDVLVLLLLAALVLCFSGVFSMEHQTGAVHLLPATPGGRSRTVKAKLLCVCALSTALYAGFAIPGFVAVCRTFGLHGWTYPLGSIPAFQGQAFPVAVFFLLHYAVQLSAVFAVSIVVLALSNRLRKTVTAASICVVCMVLPLLFKKIGVPFAHYFSLEPLFRFVPSMAAAPERIHFVFVFLTVFSAAAWLFRDLWLFFGTWKSNGLDGKRGPRLAPKMQRNGCTKEA